ncbi:MAG: metallophosphoesterase [Proteobacteria bacterium]|nr:metallophosphoesterase [Pseudomonadota bacterium]
MPDARGSSGRPRRGDRKLSGDRAGAALKVLQITDLHLRDDARPLIGVNTEATLIEVLDQAFASFTPDVVLATGDIAHDATLPTYLRFLQIIEQYHHGPKLCVPGNHDLIGPMIAARLPIDPLRVGNWVFVGLDSHVDDEVGSQVSDRDIAELVAACPPIGEKRHTLVATHHPPLEVNCPWLDKDRIQNASDLLESLARQTTVKGLVFGHAHQAVEGQSNGIGLFGTPSTCFQFEPESERFAIGDEQPGYRWLHLYDDGRIDSAVERVACSFEIDLTQRD